MFTPEAKGDREPKQKGGPTRQSHQIQAFRWAADGFLGLHLPRREDNQGGGQAR